LVAKVDDEKINKEKREEI
jgi:hypothetical protein